jgi:hypothetical protein
MRNIMMFVGFEVAFYSESQITETNKIEKISKKSERNSRK